MLRVGVVQLQASLRLPAQLFHTQLGEGGVVCHTLEAEACRTAAGLPGSPHWLTSQQLVAAMDSAAGQSVERQQGRCAVQGRTACGLVKVRSAISGVNAHLGWLIECAIWGCTACTRGGLRALSGAALPSAGSGLEALSQTVVLAALRGVGNAIEGCTVCRDG